MFPSKKKSFEPSSFGLPRIVDVSVSGAAIPLYTPPGAFIPHIGNFAMHVRVP